MATINWRRQEAALAQQGGRSDTDGDVVADDQAYEQYKTCFFCGGSRGRASAYWCARERYIGICRECALDDLPRLMADALVGGHDYSPRGFCYIRGWLTQIVSTFWKAIATAINQRFL